MNNPLHQISRSIIKIHYVHPWHDSVMGQTGSIKKIVSRNLLLRNLLTRFWNFQNLRWRNLEGKNFSLIPTKKIFFLWIRSISYSIMIMFCKQNCHMFRLRAINISINVPQMGRYALMTTVITMHIFTSNLHIDQKWFC